MKIVIVFDLEMVYLKPNDIIEIGAVSGHPSKNGTFVPVSNFSTYVRPVHFQSIDRRTTKMTGIKTEHVKNAPKVYGALSKFRKWVQDMRTNGEVYMCSWSRNDINSLLKSCDEHHFETDWITNYNDLQDIYGKRIHANRQISLSQALLEHGIHESGIKHRAYYDARNTARLFGRAIDFTDLSKHNIQLDEDNVYQSKLRLLQFYAERMEDDIKVIASTLMFPTSYFNQIVSGEVKAKDHVMNNILLLSDRYLEERR